jgi:hypothetical protein
MEFLEKRAAVSIRFSKFSEFPSEHCILADARQTQAVCVPNWF